MFGLCCVGIGDEVRLHVGEQMEKFRSSIIIIKAKLFFFGLLSSVKLNAYSSLFTVGFHVVNVVINLVWKF